MERLTFDGKFCDIAQCRETPGGSFCENGTCSQKEVMYKNLGFEDELNFSEDYSDILAWLNAPSKEAEAALKEANNGNKTDM